jgi:hypothetical protein
MLCPSIERMTIPGFEKKRKWDKAVMSLISAELQFSPY